MDSYPADIVDSFFEDSQSEHFEHHDAKSDCDDAKSDSDDAKSDSDGAKSYVEKTDIVPPNCINAAAKKRKTICDPKSDGDGEKTDIVPPNCDNAASKKKKTICDAKSDGNGEKTDIVPPNCDNAASKKRRKTSPKCICGWSNCDFIQKQFHDNLLDNHVWVGVFQKINAPPGGEDAATVSGRTAMIKTMALRAGIYHHLKVSPDKQTAGRFYVARYHFPQPILEHCGQRRQTLLSKKEVRDLDQKIGDTILFKRINTVTSLMNTQHLSF